MTSTDRKLLGGYGEHIARAYLNACGYELLEQNYRTPVGEIDIIAKKNNMFKFIEVKTRTTYLFGAPFEFISQRKKLHLLKASNYYLAKKRALRARWQIEVVSILLAENFTVEDIDLLPLEF